MPKVTVLVATYNNGLYIEELLNSLLVQTHEDLDIVVRDDGSLDDTLSIVERIRSKDARVRILDLKSDLRSAKTNFFTLLLHTEGVYTMFCDADDVWKPDKVEKTLNLMLRTERESASDTPILVHTDLEVVSETLEPIAPSLFSYEKLSAKRNRFKNLLVQNNVTGCTVMINHALKSMVSATPDETVMHDWWLALIAAAFGKTAFLSESTIFYRQHGNNQVGAYNAGDLTASFQKLRKKDRMRAIYLSMFRQAGCFAETFRDKLQKEQYDIAKRYSEMEFLKKPGKVLRILRFGYYKNTFFRNIGQFFVI